MIEQIAKILLIPVAWHCIAIASKPAKYYHTAQTDTEPNCGYRYTRCIIFQLLKTRMLHYACCSAYCCSQLRMFKRWMFLATITDSGSAGLDARRSKWCAPWIKPQTKNGPCRRRTMHRQTKQTKNTSIQSYRQRKHHTTHARHDNTIKPRSQLHVVLK